MPRQLPPLKALRAFEAAARHQSFSRAAEELHVTHAAISQQVRSLEDWLGVKLFRRVTRGVELMDGGRRYQSFLTDVFDRLDQETRELLTRLDASRVVVRADPQFAALWLVPKISEFSRRHPDIELSIVTETGAFDGRRDSADLAIVYSYTAELQHPISLSCELLVAVDAYPVCHPDLYRKADSSDPAALLGRNLLHDEDRQWWRQWFEACDVKPPEEIPGPLYSHSHMALLAAERGQGIALLDDLETAEAMAAGRLVRLNERGVPAGAYFLLQRQPGTRNDAVARTKAWVVEEMAVFRSGHRPGDL